MQSFLFQSFHILKYLREFLFEVLVPEWPLFDLSEVSGEEEYEGGRNGGVLHGPEKSDSLRDIYQKVQDCHSYLVSWNR